MASSLNLFDDLPPRIRDIAKQVNVTTPEEALRTPITRFLDPCAAAKRLSTVVSNCSPEDIRLLKEAAAKIIAKRPVRITAPLRCDIIGTRITFGCEALDRATGGGIGTNGITEICGVSASGKTQLLLQLSLSVQLPLAIGGLAKGVAYICTEVAFPSKRLVEISKRFSVQYSKYDINYLGNIFIEHVFDPKDLLACIMERIPKLLQTVGIGLIIIDSIAAILRLYTNLKERACDMRKLTNALLSYSYKYDCAVICVNQVISHSKRQSKSNLGLAWTHLGRTRIRISKVPKQLKLEERLLTVRKLEIMYAPETPNEFAEFLITSEGIIDVPAT